MWSQERCTSHTGQDARLTGTDGGADSAKAEAGHRSNRVRWPEPAQADGIKGCTFLTVMETESSKFLRTGMWAGLPAPPTHMPTPCSLDAAGKTRGPESIEEDV